jgi:AraC-like DNA-binding protein
MGLCVPLSSTDPAELATVMRPVNGDFVVTERGTFRSNAVHLNLSRLWMQHVEEELSRIWQTAASSTRVAIWFQTRPGPAIGFQGSEVQASDIGVCPIGQPIWQRLTGRSSWGSMSLPLNDWADLSTVAGCDPLSSPAGVILVPGASNLMRLQRLHRATARLASSAPELIANSDVARGIEQSLIHAMVECLEPATVSRFDLPPQRRSKIMQRFRDMLEEYEDAPIYVPELCEKLGVASRTLRKVCHEYLGIGPRRYLDLRRMHLARRALRSSDVSETSVTEIAMRFGFWELGRFSVEYRTLFGESPSGTLRRQD